MNDLSEAPCAERLSWRREYGRSGWTLVGRARGFAVAP